MNYFLKPNVDNKLLKINVLKKTHSDILSKINIINSTLILFFIFTLRGYNDFFFFGNLLCNNTILGFFFITVLVSFFFSFFFKIIVSNRFYYSITYFFTILFIMLFLPIIFLANTLFTFVFLMEMISSLMFLKLITSRVFFLNKKTNLNRGYINIIFFQFFTTFLASMFIFIALITFIYLFGTSE